MQKKAELFCRVALKHGECLSAKTINIGEKVVQIKLELNVEMPFQYRVDGHSPNRVDKTETVIAYLRDSFPWSTPFFTLRMNFPRNLPHLQPGRITELPEPCLVDGSPREFFFQFGLAEVGIFHLIDQMAIWLRKAATSSLIDYSQGWEPTLRQNMKHFVYLDVQAQQNSVNRAAGFKIFDSEFYRSGLEVSKVDEEMTIILNASTDLVPLRHDIKDAQLSVSYKEGDVMLGKTSVGLVWAGKNANGDPIISDQYSPETVSSLGELKAKAEYLNCHIPLNTFFQNLERYFKGYILKRPIPVGIVLAVRRPCSLIGSRSNIELLPYVIEINAAQGRTSLFSDGDDEPVKPCQALGKANPELLRSVSGTPKLPAVAMIGAGSVGSKLTLHFAKSGIPVSSIADSGYLRPHNTARHGLVKKQLSCNKAEAMAKEIEELGQSPSTYTNDLVLGLQDRKTRAQILPKAAAFAVNSTASLAVREALSSLKPKDSKQRQIEAALFGRGHGAFLLTEGVERNPNLNDLIGELYANKSDDRQRELLFDEKYGLAQIQIGPGCGSLTMPMTDARLSSMTGGLAEEIQRIIGSSPPHAEVVVAINDEGSPTTTWSRKSIMPFSSVPIGGVDDWQIRVSPTVLAQMRAEQADHPTEETGGVMIGLCSARLRTITVIDLLPAPPDSERTATKFVLGTKGLKALVERRFKESGNSLVDVGTWHTHLADSGPSQLDRNTALDLAKDRTPPSCLFIVTPTQLHAYMEDCDG